MNPSVALHAAWESVAIASLQGSALILVVWTVQRLLKCRLGPAWSFALWFLVLLRLSLPVLPTSSLSWEHVISGWRHLAPSLPAESRLARETALAAGTPPMTTDGQTAALQPQSPVASSAAPMALSAIPIERPLGDSAGFFWLGRLWMLGVLGLLVWQTLASWHFRRRIRRWSAPAGGMLLGLADECRREMGVRCRFGIRVTPHVDTPCLYGVFRPVILVPSALEPNLTGAEWRDIFLHELAHVRRLDPLVNFWMSLAAAVHWFNPLVWWSVRRMREDRELACDALVIARRDSGARRAYGETLLKLASFPVAAGGPGAAIGILENGGPLKSRLQALGARPRFWMNALVGAAVLLLLGACALTRKPVTPVPPEIQTVRLEGFTDFPQAAVAPGALQRHQDNPATWAQLPKGDQIFFGVPFEITGLIRLAGTGGERFNEWYFRPAVEGIPVGQAFARLYLLHATSYYGDIGTPVAIVRLHYADGTSADLPIRYGYEVLNDWRQRYESTSRLRDPDSRIAWTGQAAFLAEYGNSLRFCISSLRNPHPRKTVRTVDLISTRSEASETIGGLSVGGRELPPEWRSTPKMEDRDTRWSSRLRFRAVDAVSGKPVPNMELRLEVAEPGVHSRVGVYRTDASGWATLRLPHPKLDYISIWADRDGYVPRFIQWTRRRHGAFPKEYIYRAEPGVRIHGLVEDENGVPVSGAVVRINGPAPDFSGDAKEFLMLTHSMTVTGPDGRWSCPEIPRDLPPDQVAIRILHPDFPRSARHRLDSNELAGAAILTRLPGGVVFRSKVLTPDRQPVAGAKVQAAGFALEERIRSVTTDAAGEFSLRLPQSSGQIEVLVQADGHAPRRMLKTALELVWTADPLVLEPGRSVDIRVTGPAGRPLEGVLVEGVMPGGPGPASRATPELILDHPVTTDRNGEARWSNAPPEGMVFRILKDGFSSTLLPLPAGTNRVSIELAEVEVLIGLAVDARTGRPLEYFKVRQGERPAPGGAVRWQEAPVAVGRRGRYQIRNFRPGNDSMVFRIEADGYAPSGLVPASDLRVLKPHSASLNPL